MDEGHGHSRKMHTAVFFVEFYGNVICLICKQKIAVLKEYNLKCHYTTIRKERNENNKGEDRKQ